VCGDSLDMIVINIAKRKRDGKERRSNGRERMCAEGDNEGCGQMPADMSADDISLAKSLRWDICVSCVREAH
jgi:hypothetical protein